MKKYSIYYWKFVMGMIVVTNLITLFIMNQGSKSLEKEAEVVLFMFIAALLMMLIEQWKLKTSKEFPLFILGEMMFAIMLTPIFFMAYRYMTKVFSLVWMFHLSNSFISFLWLVGMIQFVLVFISPFVAVIKAIQFVVAPYKNEMI